MTPRFAVIEAPSVLGLFPGGVETLPDALLAAGLADAVGAVVDAGEFPIVLGGDCSIVLGCLLALRRRGRHGLLFLDGHADFSQPAAEPSGEAASMDLALATGRGPAVVADLEGRGPLVRDADVVLFGRRDADEAREAGSQRVEDTAVRMIDLAEVRAHGAADRARLAVEHLARTGSGLWLHLDADVLDDAVMPAVDYRLPGGLSWDELVITLRTAVASGRVRWLDVTIFNPELDADGSIAATLADALVRALRP